MKSLLVLFSFLVVAYGFPRSSVVVLPLDEAGLSKLLQAPDVCASYQCSKPSTGHAVDEKQSHPFDVVTMVEMENQQFDVRFKGIATLEAVEPCNYQLKLQNVELEGLPSVESTEGFEIHPLFFNFNGAEIVNSCPEVGDHPVAVNLKLAILSALSLEPSNEETAKDESDQAFALSSERLGPYLYQALRSEGSSNAGNVFLEKVVSHPLPYVPIVPSIGNRDPTDLSIIPDKKCVGNGDFCYKDVCCDGTICQGIIRKCAPCVGLGAGCNVDKCCSQYKCSGSFLTGKKCVRH